MPTKKRSSSARRRDPSSNAQQPVWPRAFITDPAAAELLMEAAVVLDQPFTARQVAQQAGIASKVVPILLAELASIGELTACSDGQYEIDRGTRTRDWNDDIIAAGAEAQSSGPAAVAVARHAKLGELVAEHHALVQALHALGVGNREGGTRESELADGVSVAIYRLQAIRESLVGPAEGKPRPRWPGPQLRQLEQLWRTFKAPPLEGSSAAALATAVDAMNIARVVANLCENAITALRLGSDPKPIHKWVSDALAAVERSDPETLAIDALFEALDDYPPDQSALAPDVIGRAIRVEWGLLHNTYATRLDDADYQRALNAWRRSEKGRPAGAKTGARSVGKWTTLKEILDKAGITRSESFLRDRAADLEK